MAGMIPERTVEEVAYRNDIVEIIGSRVALKRAGSSWKGLCPFHQEKTPSFHVNPQRQTFHCFGCGAGGDVFKFVMTQEGLDFVSAVRSLAARAGIVIEEERGTGPSGLRKELQKLHSEVAAKYHQTLLKSPTAEGARAYLESRALTKQTIADFQIGYAPDTWDSVLNWALKKKVSLDRLVESGLVVERRDDAGKVSHYDRFRDRIMFPIFDAQSRVVGFSGRTMSKDHQGAKYVNSPETPLFQKGRILYGMHMARAAILKARQALICEGQIDVIRCHQAGFAHAVASQGTAFTDEQVALLKRCTDSVLLVFDGDEAGREAAVKTGRAFIGAGMAVRVARLPAGEDPDSFIRKNGAEAFRKAIDDAVSAVSFHLEVLGTREDLRKEAGAMRAAREVVKTVVLSPNAVQRSRMLEEAATLLRLPPDALATEVDEAVRRVDVERRRAAVAPRTPREEQGRRPAARARAEDAPRPEERWLCEHIVHADGSAGPTAVVAEYLPLEMVRDPLCRTLLQAAVEASVAGVPLREVLSEAEASTPGLDRFAAELAALPDKSRGDDDRAVEAVRGLVLGMWRRRLEAEREALGDRDPERRAQLTNDLQALKRWASGRPIVELEMS